jgi:hypothetical protein
MKVSLIIFAALLVTVLGLTSESQAQNSNVVLIAESDSYVPSNYAGARPLTPGSTISLVALGAPRIAKYQWRINGRQLTELSGIGQSRVDIQLTDRPIDAQVSVYQNSDLIGVDQITINPDPLEIVLYQNHPTRGPLFQTALSGQIRSTSPVIDIIGSAYGANGVNPLLQWQINNSESFALPAVSLDRQASPQTTIVASYLNNIFTQATKELRIQFSR